MKLSVSNIAWDKKDAIKMYKYLKEIEFDAIEIAPTIIIEDNPYENITDAIKFATYLKDSYNLEISSMQSIWYGRNENIFIKEQAEKLLEYTKKAIKFAKSINCKNIVFGCPKNRNNINNEDIEKVVYFFKSIDEIASKNGVFFSIEPNPTIYGTNFINTTTQAFDFVKHIQTTNIKVNIDFGTIIENKEDLKNIEKNIDLVNNVHISEPNLALIQKRKEHIKLSNILKKSKYDKFVSIEMKKNNDVEVIKEIIEYVKEVF